MCIYIYIWVTDKIIVILVLSCFALAFLRLHKTFISDRGRPYTDTPFVIPPGILKSSQPIGDDPNLCMALDLTYNFVRYSYFFGWWWCQIDTWLCNQWCECRLVVSNAWVLSGGGDCPDLPRPNRPEILWNQRAHWRTGDGNITVWFQMC